ncbi:IclR family transcriptional regulator [Streptomyces massasporeus]|uniref:IclR family transcriptional regulator n=1 Tax=Streptomyces massasporeus TaxID=67324 RepID=UPI0033CC2E32
MGLSTVVRSLRVLEAVAEHQPVSVGELSKIFGLSESTMRRTLRALKVSGWLRADPLDATRWEIGAWVFGVRPTALRNTRLFPAARELMIRLRDAPDETVLLSVPDALNDMVVVDRVDCGHAVRPFHAIGDTSRQYATAPGRAVLAHLPVPEADGLVTGGLDDRGAPIATDAAELRAELRHIRDRGYAVDQNRHRPGVCAVAAPVLDHDGVPLAAVSVSVPEYRFGPVRLDALGQLVKDTGARITARHCN